MAYLGTIGWQRPDRMDVGLPGAIPARRDVVALPLRGAAHRTSRRTVRRNNPSLLRHRQPRNSGLACLGKHPMEEQPRSWQSTVCRTGSRTLLCLGLPVNGRIENHVSVPALKRYAVTRHHLVKRLNAKASFGDKKESAETFVVSALPTTTSSCTSVRHTARAN